MTAIVPHDQSPAGVGGRLPEQRGRHPEPRMSRERPIRVLNVVHRFLPELGGTENHVAEVTSRLAARPDMDVVVLTTDRSGLMRVAEVVNGVPVMRKAGWPRTRDYYFSPGMLAGIRRGGWDVIHFQGVHTLVPLMGMAAARMAGIPYVLTLHSGGDTSLGRAALRGPQFRALAPLLRDAARLIAVSRFERRRFAAATGIPEERFTVINNGGALPPAPPDTARVPGRILTIGRLERYKGHHRAIEALPIVRAEMPRAELVVLGAGPYEAGLRDAARRHGVEDAVTIRHIPPADRLAMSEALGKASVMAALSSYEANPVSVLEAASVGLPVVGLNVAGTADLVEDGLVDGVDPGATTGEIAAALLRRLRSACDTPAHTVPTWDGCAEQVAAMYLQVVGERATAAEVRTR
jgi:glycosyltransferase involved in cell wall biosynthesis